LSKNFDYKYIQGYSIFVPKVRRPLIKTPFQNYMMASILRKEDF